VSLDFLVKPPSQKFSTFAPHLKLSVNRSKQMGLICSRPPGNRNLFWLVPPTAKPRRHYRRKKTTRRNAKAEHTNPNTVTHLPM
jgi:hypothetical protein